MRSQVLNPLSTSSFSGTVNMGVDVSDTSVLGRERKIVSCVRSPEVTHREERGFASIHISTQLQPGNPTARTGVAAVDSKIMARVSWATGIQSTDAIIDITKGAMFTVGAADHISISAFFDTVALGGTFALSGPWQVSASIFWVGSASPRPCYCTSYAELLGAAATSSTFQIPDHARDGLLLVTNPLILPSLTANFYSPGTVGGNARLLYAVTDPFSNGVPVVAGAYQVTFTNTGAQTATITPTWELWL